MKSASQGGVMKLIRWWRLWLARHRYAAHLDHIRAYEHQQRQHQEYLEALLRNEASLRIALMDAERDPSMHVSAPEFSVETPLQRRLRKSAK